jgi:glyceraldehyde-3-phosphate dehydrogenase (NADP+)
MTEELPVQNSFKYLIGNEWLESKDVLEVRNPYNNEIVSATFFATEKDVNDAVHAAVHAFEETRRLPSYKRAEILSNIMDRVQKRSEEFARTIALEAGKPIIDARAEVERAIGTFQIAAEESKRMRGNTFLWTSRRGQRIGQRLIRDFLSVRY